MTSSPTKARDCVWTVRSTPTLPATCSRTIPPGASKSMTRRASGHSAMRLQTTTSTAPRKCTIRPNPNAWDDGYPQGGNFWSNYRGADQCSGPGQDVCNGPDGIGDTPYPIQVLGV